MERFLGALSLTFMLSGLAAVAQIQHPSQADLTVVVDAELMTPSSDGNFQADTVLSRAELARILVKAFHLDQRRSRQVSAMPIQDVPPSHWAYNDIQIVIRSGIMQGYRAGRFFPNQRVTRAEAFSILAQADGVFQFSEQTVNKILARYPDAAKIPGWAKKSMATALYEGFVNVKKGDRIDPLSPMTRSDMAYALSMHLQQHKAPAESLWMSENSSQS